jgi:hypothetical protein
VEAAPVAAPQKSLKNMLHSINNRKLKDKSILLETSPLRNESTAPMMSTPPREITISDKLRKNLISVKNKIQLP